LPTANNAILATGSTGIPILTTTLPSAVQVSVNSLNSGTSASSTSYWSGSGTWTTPTAGIPGTSTANLILMSTVTSGN